MNDALVLIGFGAYVLLWVFAAYGCSRALSAAFRKKSRPPKFRNPQP